MDVSDTTDRERALFEQALELGSGAERLAFLKGACGEHAALLTRVQALLQAHEATEGFLPGRPASRTTVLVVTEKPGDRIGRYKLREKIGEGGCGVVYVAEQEEPVRRKVALKVIKLGMDTKSVVARFEAERQALAMMDHPNIAKVLDAGATDTGRPYFVMELVRGIRVTEYCDQNNLPTRTRLDLFIQVCRAVQHAHQKGIIHRDLKPSNILVTLHDGVPVPKVIDFGIAKATEGRLSDLTVYTELNQFIGTPAYMSPEQAEMSGLDIDTRSDIYSLGVLLYELLTGQTPFAADELMRLGLDEMRRTIREKEPVRPSTRLSTMLAGELTTTAKHRASEPPRLIHLVRGDLDWIVMKSLEKDRTRRYETANGLALDLQRHLNSEPVSARPPTTVYRFQKLLRRNKLVFAAATAVLLALLIGIIGSATEAVRATRAERIARFQSDRAKAEAVRAQNAERVAIQKSIIADQQRQRADEEALAASHQAYAADINLAQTALESENLGRAAKLLQAHLPNSPNQTDLRGFEWRYLWNLCRGDEIATLQDHRGIMSCVAFSPKGGVLATAGFEGSVRIWDWPSRTAITNLTGLSGRVLRLALSFSPDGHMLAAAGGTNLIVWATANWKPLSRLDLRTLSPRTRVYPVIFSPDGQTLGAPIDGDLKLWNTAAWQLRGSIESVTDMDTMLLAYVPNARGQLVATAHAGQIQFWDLESHAKTGQSAAMLDRPYCLAFSPDGGLLAAADSSGNLKLIDPQTKAMIASAKAHSPYIQGLAFSLDGKTLATCGADQLIQLWDYSRARNDGTLQNFRTLKGHQNEVWAVAFSPDGQTLASASKDGTVKLWSSRPEKRAKDILEDTTMPLWFSPDGRTLLTRKEDTLRYWDLESGRQHRVFPHLKPLATRFSEAISSDGKTLAFGFGDGRIQMWDLDKQACIATNQADTSQVTALAFSPDHKVLAAGRQRSGQTQGHMTLLDLATGQSEILTSNYFGNRDAVCVAFSPDGRVLAWTGPDYTVKLRDLSSKQELHTLKAHAWDILALAFSPDSKLLVTAGNDGTACLWEVASGKKLADLAGHKGGIAQVAFSPDGRTVGTGSGDRTVKLWSVASHRELLTLKNLSADWVHLLFSPGGRTLATGGLADEVQLWRAASLAEIDASEKARTNAVAEAGSRD